VDKLDPALFQENERTSAVADARIILDIGTISLLRGGELPNVQVAYETWGTLNSDRSNAILVCHALTGDSHAIGWWDRLTGPGKAIDTERYFVIGSNSLGGCQGTTGPSSLASDGVQWGSRFPTITVEDMTTAQCALLDHLGIDTLLAAAGGSMGGMNALEITRRGRARKAWLTASARTHTAMQIGFNEVARQAIIRDPNFNGGDYYSGHAPAEGLSVARMVGHLSYLSDWSFTQKFGRELQEGRSNQGREMFQVESYLSYQGDKFVHRFDANSLIAVTNAIDIYDPQDIGASTAEYLLSSFASDWIYPSHLSQELYDWLTANGLKAAYTELGSPLGHDAFLLDAEGQGPLVKAFLEAE